MGFDIPLHVGMSPDSLVLHIYHCNSTSSWNDCREIPGTTAVKSLGLTLHWRYMQPVVSVSDMAQIVSICHGMFKQSAARMAMI